MESAPPVETHTAIADVPEADWEALLPPGAGALLPSFLAPCGQVLGRASWRVFVRRSGPGGAPLAVAPGLLFSLDLAELIPDPLRRFIVWIRRFRPDAFRPRVLELGPPCCPGPPMASTDPGAHAPEVIEAAWHEVAVRGAAEAVVVRDFAGPAPLPVERTLAALGFVPIAQRPTFISRITAASFAEHLAGLRAPYRRHAERHLRSDLRLSVVDDFAPLADEMARLFALNAARATESRRERIDADVVRAWARCRATRALILTDRTERMVLAALVLWDRPVLHFVRVGFELAVGRATGAYFRLLYELLRLAVENGFTHVDFGLTSAEPKLRVGAQPVSLRVWMRHRNPLVQRLIRAARPWLLREVPLPVRRALRSSGDPVRPWWYGDWGAAPRNGW